MKNKVAFLFAFTLISMLFAVQSFAQAIDSTRIRKSEQQMLKEKEHQDKQRLDNAVDLKRETRSDAKAAKVKANDAWIDAKEASRIENEADNAAKQAKKSARMEAKAQKNRDDADKQAKKAGRVTQKSMKH